MVAAAFRTWGIVAIRLFGIGAKPEQDGDQNRPKASVGDGEFS